MVQMRRWRSGSGNEASDPLLPKEALVEETAAPKEEGAGGGETFAEKLERRRKEQMLRKERDENNLGMFAVAGVEHRSSSWSSVRKKIESRSPKKKKAIDGRTSTNLHPRLCSPVTLTAPVDCCITTPWCCRRPSRLTCVSLLVGS
jgi:hypothetical protein